MAASEQVDHTHTKASMYYKGQVVNTQDVYGVSETLETKPETIQNGIDSNDPVSQNTDSGQQQEPSLPNPQPSASEPAALLPTEQSSPSAKLEGLKENPEPVITTKESGSSGSMLYPELPQFEHLDNVRQLPGTRLFRSARPDQATERDIKVLQELGIKTILDCRDMSEVIKDSQLSAAGTLHAAYVLYAYKGDGNFTPRDPAAAGTAGANSPGGGRRYVLPVAHCMPYYQELLRRADWAVKLQLPLLLVLDRIRDTHTAKTMATERIIIKGGLSGLYRDIIDFCRATVRDALRLLCEPANLPALLCCSFGKDRTGVVTALVLSVLGFPRKHVCEDYARTADSIKQSARLQARSITEWSSHGLTDPSFATADYSTMDELLTYIDNKYGSIDEYLDSIGFGADERQKLRNVMTVTENGGTH